MTTLADQLRLLLPPVSYSINAPLLSAAIEAEAKALTATVGTSDAVYKTMFPDSGEGLDEWERLLGLPDPCLIGVKQTTRQRINAVISKLRGSGGQSKSFFISLAKALGYDITITNFRPARAGLARAGDPINGGDWSFAWRVNAPAVTVTRAAAGMAAAGDPLAAWGNAVLECRFNQMKPAESFLIFGYGGQNAEDQ
jgi:uncharacterized protein YmfQ (DUF2313 family)